MAANLASTPAATPEDTPKTFWTDPSELGFWAASGFFVRAFQLAIQKRPMLSNPLTHVAFAGAALLVGHEMYKLEAYASSVLEQEKLKLVRRRLRAADAGGDKVSE